MLVGRLHIFSEEKSIEVLCPLFICWIPCGALFVQSRLSCRQHSPATHSGSTGVRLRTETNASLGMTAQHTHAGFLKVCGQITVPGFHLMAVEQIHISCYRRSKDVGHNLTQVLSLVRELRSHMPRGVARNLKKTYIGTISWGIIAFSISCQGTRRTVVSFWPCLNTFCLSVHPSVQ